MHEERIEIGDTTDIGRAICRYQALLNEGESLRLAFLDGGVWIGTFTLTREEAEDLAVKVEGTLFRGRGDDRGISLSFRCEPDGPVGLPLSVYNVDGEMIGFYTDDEDEVVDTATQRAAFWASGVSFTATNAPPVKPEAKLGYAADSARHGAELRAAAKKAEQAWVPLLGRQKGVKGGNNGEKWFRYQGKKLVTMAPNETIGTDSEGSWPRPMPKPVVSERKTRTAKARYVHKRTNEAIQTT